jgi:hypothetical protein
MDPVSQQKQGNKGQGRQKAERLAPTAEDRQANHLGAPARQACAQLRKYAQHIEVYVTRQKIRQAHQVGPNSAELRPQINEQDPSFHQLRFRLRHRPS